MLSRTPTPHVDGGRWLDESAARPLSKYCLNSWFHVLYIQRVSFRYYGLQDLSLTTVVEKFSLRFIMNINEQNILDFHHCLVLSNKIKPMQIFVSEKFFTSLTLKNKCLLIKRWRNYSLNILVIKIKYIIFKLLYCIYVFRICFGWLSWFLSYYLYRRVNRT